MRGYNKSAGFSALTTAMSNVNKRAGEGPTQFEINGPLDIPDRLSVDIESEFYSPIGAKLDVYFDGNVRNKDVHEYCISGGWIKKILRMKNGKVKRERGKVVLLTMRGRVQVVEKGERPDG